MRSSSLAPALVAEFLGTALLILLGDGVVAQVVLVEKATNWIVITAGWALAVTLAVYVTGRVSGGHLNPAVSLALATRGDFPASRVVPYWIAQISGAFVGGLIVYLNYYTAFTSFEDAYQITRGLVEDGSLAGKAAGGAGVFATFPAFAPVWGNLLSEALGTAVLLMVVRAVTDRRNASPGRGFEPMLVGATVFAIGLSLGGLTGYAINPARDFGPRLVAYFCGWGSAVFSSHGWYFWIPIVGPLIGGIAGIWLYDLLIKPNLPADEPDEVASVK
jgi:glycerol uptake facilitator protein